MAKRKKMWWMYTPPKKSKPKVPEALKTELAEKAKELIETTFKAYGLELDKSAESQQIFWP
jgi:hypothetical protein